jgi:hypothetical protein
MGEAPPGKTRPPFSRDFPKANAFSCHECVDWPAYRSLRIEVVRFPFEPQPLRPYRPRMCAKNVKTEQLAPADIL